MQDIVAKLLNNYAGIILFVVMVVIALNIFLTGLKKFLGYLKDKTASQADDKAYAIVVKVLGYSDKVLEFLSANSTALPPAVKAELDKKEWEDKQEAPAPIEPPKA